MSSLFSSLQALMGIAVFIGLAWLAGDRRAPPNWRLIAIGLGLQLVIAWIVFRSSLLQGLLALINDGVLAIVDALETGTAFVFGYLGGDPANVSYPFAVTDGGATVVLAFRILPLILFFSVISAILWYYRILPWIVRGMALVLRRGMKVGGSVALSAAANIFIGMVESPALIRPYLLSLNRSELFVVMSCGMATVAGSVMVLYSVILQDVLANPLAHILTASVISVPAAIMIALIMIPPLEQASNADAEFPPTYHNLMDAIARGTADGIRLMVNVGAMLIVLVALVALVNSALSLVPGIDLSLEGMLGWLFAPLTWLMGIPWQEAPLAGSLMGTKTVLNELLAFLALADVSPGQLSEKSFVILTYGLCGFANFGSLGIMIGGLSSMCPDRVADIVELAPRSLISGTLATCMTAAIAGLLV